MKPSTIKTTHKSGDHQLAEVTLADGRTYCISANRRRVGLRGDRSYVWDFKASGPGLAHVANRHERISCSWQGTVALNSVDLGCRNMTAAKRRLAQLLSA